MKPENFISKINKSLQTNRVEEDLLSDEVRFLRSRYILKMIGNLSKVLNMFDFKDDIVFENTVPYINLNGIKLKLNSAYFLKHSSKKFLSQSLNSINFIKRFRLNPKLIIDLGACWGEYTLFFAKEFPKCKIFSIEGSPINFNTLKDNIKINNKLGDLIKAFNLIITNFDGVEKITNNLNTMNTITKVKNTKINLVQIKSKKLTSFLFDEGISEIDFIKIDIEGAELKLLNDLKKINFKLLQIELINYNELENNLNFIRELSSFCNFYDYKSFKKISFIELENLIKVNLTENPTVDLFCEKKTNNLMKIN